MQKQKQGESPRWAFNNKCRAGSVEPGTCALEVSIRFTVILPERECGMQCRVCVYLLAGWNTLMISKRLE